MINLLLLGPIGSGKGTVGSHLSRGFSLEQISMGQALAEASASDPDLDARMKAGLQSTQEQWLSAVRSVMNRPPSMPDGSSATGRILDGFVRNPDQVNLFVELVQSGEVSSPNAIVVLEARREILDERISNRLTCDACGEIYNLVSAPPPSLDRCNAACGGRLKSREMDKDPKSRANRRRIDEELAIPAIGILTEMLDVPVIRLNAEQDIPGLLVDAERSVEGVLSLRCEREAEEPRTRRSFSV